MASTRAVTLLFTDLVGSTARAAQLGPEGAEELRQIHFGLLRGALDAAGGSEVKNLGDGLMAVFTSPSRALACAVAMQQAMDRHNRRAGSDLAIRIGLSAGEVNEEDGDFFGEPVVEASRLCAAAAGGQILAAEIVPLMVGRHVTQDLVRLDPMELKGLPGRVAVVEVRWEPQGDAAADSGTVPLPAQLLGGTTSGLFAFFGRSAELDHLTQAHKTAELEAQLHTVLVAGEPGMGKTTLAAQAARLAHRGGSTVLFGACEEGLGAPYQPWLGALGHLLEHRGTDLLTRMSPTHAAALSRLLPSALAGHPPPGVPPADAATERYVTMEAVTALLAAASADAALYLVLDDLHWADAASLQLIRHLLAAPGPLRVLLVGTYRDSDVGRASPLGALLADLWRDPRVSRVRLSGLSDTDVVALVEAAAGYELDDEGVALAQAVSRETDGNPFFVGELLRHLGESGMVVQGGGGRWSLTSGLDRLSLPSSIREVVNHRVDRLGPDVLPALSAAAVIGREFDPDILCAVSGLDEDRLLDLLEASARAALVSETESGRYRFLHALIQRTLYEELSANRRQRLHQRAAEAMEAAGAARFEPAEIAHHWLTASRPVDSAKALEYATAAGDAALGALAPDDAADWYARALELVADDTPGMLGTRARLLLKLGQARAQGQRPGFWDLWLESAELARKVGDDRLVVDVALCRGYGQETAMEADPRRLSLLGEALELVGPDDTAERALLLAALAEESDPRDWPARRSAVAEARAVANRLGDRQTLMAVLIRTADMASTPEERQSRRGVGRQLLELTRDADPASRYKALFFDTSLRVEEADLAGLDAELDEVTRIASETGLAVHRWETTHQRSWRLLLAGQPAEAEAAAEEAFSLYRMDDPIGLAVYGTEIMAIRRYQGRQQEMLEPFRAVVAANPALPVMRLALMLLLCECERHDEARPMFEAERAAGFDPPRDTTWVQSMLRYAEVAVELADAGASALLYDALAPLRDMVSYNVAMVGGAVALFLGMMATTLGRFEQAEADLSLALGLHERLRAPYWVARTQLARAELLQARGRPGDREESGRLVATARASVDRYGCHGLDRIIGRVTEP